MATQQKQHENGSKAGTAGGPYPAAPSRSRARRTDARQVAQEPLQGREALPRATAGTFLEGGALMRAAIIEIATLPRPEGFREEPSALAVAAESALHRGDQEEYSRLIERYRALIRANGSGSRILEPRGGMPAAIIDAAIPGREELETPESVFSAEQIRELKHASASWRSAVKAGRTADAAACLEKYERLFRAIPST